MTEYFNIITTCLYYTQKSQRFTTIKIEKQCFNQQIIAVIFVQYNIKHHN